MSCFRSGNAGRSKSETRRPKAERNPKSEARIHSHPSGVAVQRLKPFSDFGFRPYFGSGVSAFGFEGCQPCVPSNRPDSSAALCGNHLRADFSCLWQTEPPCRRHASQLSCLRSADSARDWLGRPRSQGAGRPNRFSGGAQGRGPHYRGCYESKSVKP